MRKFVCLVAIVCSLCALPAKSQEPDKRFTNQDVIGMTQLGLSDDVVIAKIRSVSAANPQSASFDTSVDGLKALKAANVSDAVIRVMINPAAPPAMVVA